MRILYLSQKMTGGGASTHREGIISGLRRRGHTVDVQEGGWPVFKARNYDWVYCRHRRLFFLPIKNLALEFNGSEAWIKKHWQGGKYLYPPINVMEKIALRFPRVIFAVSEPCTKQLPKAVLNPNGVDLDVFKPMDATKKREELGYSQEDVVVGFFGSFGPWHGIEGFGSAAGWTPQRFKFLLVGDGVKRKEAEKTFPIDRTTFLGMVEKSKIPELMNVCDVLVMPTIANPDGTEFFGSPTKLWEYMAVGKTILASRIGAGKILTDKDAILYDELLAKDIIRASRVKLSARHKAVSWLDRARTIENALLTTEKPGLLKMLARRIAEHVFP